MGHRATFKLWILGNPNLIVPIGWHIVAILESMSIIDNVRRGSHIVFLSMKIDKNSLEVLN